MGFKSIWTPERVIELNMLAGQQKPAAVIAAQLGTTAHSVLQKAQRLGISVIRYTEEEAAEYQARARERDRTKKRRRKTSEPAAVAASKPVGTGNWAQPYRRLLAPGPELSLSERRNMLTEAVRNTAAMGVR